MNKTNTLNHVISIILILTMMIATVFVSAPTDTWAETSNVGSAENYDEFEALLKNTDIDTIHITKDFSLKDTENPSPGGITVRRSVTINGNGNTITGNNMGYLIFATNDEAYQNTEVHINDLTFKDFENAGMLSKWASDSWGGVLKLYCNATITNCKFINNATTVAEVDGNRNYGDGGAIYHRRPDSAMASSTKGPTYNTLLTIKNCSFTGNSAAGWGGAICTTQPVIIENSAFTNNTSYREGGAAMLLRSATMKDCVFTGNEVYKPREYKEGEQYYQSNNNVPGKGGAVYFSGDTARDTVAYEKGRSITDCNFYNNKAATSGGAIYAYRELIYSGNNNFYGNTPTEDNGLGVGLFNNGYVESYMTEGEKGSSLVDIQGSLKAPTITNETTTLAVNAGRTKSMYVKTDAKPLPAFSAVMKDGSNLPDWIQVDKRTGKITASPSVKTPVGNTVIAVSASNGVAHSTEENPDAATKHFTVKVLKPQKYTVTLNVNGGKKLSKSKVTVLGGGKYGKLPSPTKKGHTFKGWYTKISGGTPVTANTVVSITKNQTLYAKWAPKKYNVTFLGNKGKVSQKTKVTKVKTYGKKFGKLPVAKRKGYKFSGWYTKAKGGKKITSKTKMTYAKNIKLYARWKKK